MVVTPYDFKCLLWSLQNSSLEVILVPSRDREIASRGGMIRAVVSKNPDWYRKLCEDYPSARTRRSFKPDTKIKRNNIIKVLEKLSKGQKVRSKYVDDLRKIAYQETGDCPF